jgi:hypothetical protein
LRHHRLGFAAPLALGEPGFPHHPAQQGGDGLNVLLIDGRLRRPDGHLLEHRRLVHHFLAPFPDARLGRPDFYLFVI